MVHDRLAGRRLRAGAFVDSQLQMERTIDPGADLTVGNGPTVTLRLPEWSGPDLTIILAGRWLLLAPEMRVIMCHDSGEDRLEGSFEELCTAGITFPFYVNVSRLNVRIASGIVVLVDFQK